MTLYLLLKTYITNILVFSDQNKSWAPYTVCRFCVECLRNWKQGRHLSIHFGIPIVGEN